MKRLKFISILVVALFMQINVFAKSTIIIRISSSNQTTQQQIINHFLKISGVSLEYSCSDAGVLIFKEDRININDPRELKTYIKNELAKVNRKFKLLMLEVIIESAESTSHC